MNRICDQIGVVFWSEYQFLGKYSQMQNAIDHVLEIPEEMMRKEDLLSLQRRVSTS